MDSDAIYFWAKTMKDANGTEVPGISVRDHGPNVGCVALRKPHAT